MRRSDTRLWVWFPREESEGKQRPDGAPDRKPKYIAPVEPAAPQWRHDRSLDGFVEGPDRENGGEHAEPLRWVGDRNEDVGHEEERKDREVDNCRRCIRIGDERRHPKPERGKGSRAHDQSDDESGKR